uniref:RRM domain-containing protein n=1 Tax=Vespula pensylvanica TaxID=30213 RepID=A0A834P7Z6_VESPE|nr:hypothetical protein H0235_004693 [Vespula pensylvanica]
MVASALRCFDYSLRAHHDGRNFTEDSVSSLIGFHPTLKRSDRYVGNLDHSVSEDLLCALFSQIGVVRGCKIIREDSFILAADLRLPVPAEQRQAFLAHANDVMYSQSRPGRKLAKRTTEERSCRLRCRPLTFYLDAFEHYENDVDLDYSIEIESRSKHKLKIEKPRLEYLVEGRMKKLSSSILFHISSYSFRAALHQRAFRKPQEVHPLKGLDFHSGQLFRLMGKLTRGDLRAVLNLESRLRYKSSFNYDDNYDDDNNDEKQKSVSHMRLIRFVPICRLECGVDPSLESATAVASVSVILTSSCQRLVELLLAIA